MYYNNVTQNVRSSTTVQVQSKLCSDICSAACLWWLFKHRFTVLALHSTHQEPVTSASAAHRAPRFERDMMVLRANRSDVIAEASAGIAGIHQPAKEVCSGPDQPSRQLPIRCCLCVADHRL